MSSSWDNSILSEKNPSRRSGPAGRGRGKYQEDPSIASYYTNGEESMWSGSNSFDDTRGTMNSYYSYDEETIGYRDDDPFFEVAAQCRAIPTRMPDIMRHFAEGASSLGIRVNQYAEELEKEGKPNSVVTAVGKVLTSAATPTAGGPNKPSSLPPSSRMTPRTVTELPKVLSEDTFGTAGDYDKDGGGEQWGQSLSVKGEIAEETLKRVPINRQNSDTSNKSLTSFMSNVSSIFDKSKRDENDHNRANGIQKRANDSKGDKSSPPSSPPKPVLEKMVKGALTPIQSYSIDHFGTVTNPMSEATETYDSFTQAKRVPSNFGKSLSD
uniref:Uncharacterized protein n=1 Tax=Corethron hystrix TaxID=216773 RepID=A0A7S1FZZ5_9STRA|mmetsp:Transcript_42365/g.99445  ORF Transcript_42365/g.99445 Transcript_42365/m.99445 type:complete len:325 (+) Transcript_42365:127-1101(+)